MKSRALRKNERETMTRHLVFQATADVNRELTKRELGLAEELRMWNFGKFARLIEEMPKHLVCHSDDVYIQMREARDRLSFGTFREVECLSERFGDYYTPATVFLKAKKVRVPAIWKFPDNLSEDEIESSLADRLTKVIQDRESFMSARRSIERRIENGLDAIKTTKMLQETWPEAWDVFVTHVSKNEGSNLPAVPVAELNALMNDFPNGLTA